MILETKHINFALETQFYLICTKANTYQGVP